MNLSVKKGVGFGLTSGIITTLGLIVGLNSGTQSALVVIGGIIIIAVSDALSDALGIHVSEEAENVHSAKEIWQATIFTFLAKFIFALTFVVPILAFSLPIAVGICIGWGILVLIIANYLMAKNNHHHPLPVIAEHLIIAILVIVASYFIGNAIRGFTA